ncbi:MAG: DUF1512 family protein, partial [Candidatus Nanohaloarchaea archaeon]
MVLFGMLGGNQGILPILVNLGILLFLFALLPRAMIWRSVKKIDDLLETLQESASSAEEKFLEATGGSIEEKRDRLEPMKNMVVSQPTGIDPAGLVEKMEHLLDLSDDKMERFVEELQEGEMDEEQKADLTMAFRGVYGTNQLYVLIRHFRELIQDMKSYQLANMVQMMLPLYEEIAEAQKEATEAFVEGVPIGDSVGPLVAAKFMEEGGEEVAEDVVLSREEVEEKEVHVLKSKGPGARLGKYGDAIEQVLEEEEIEKIIFV